MSWSNLSYGHFNDSIFQRASLISVNFFRASVENVDFTRANAINANFSYANLDRAIFTDANLYSSIFYAVYAPGANFDGANMSYTYFYGSYLEGATFTEAWAWADEPPIGVPKIKLCVFDPLIDSRWKKPDVCYEPNNEIQSIPPITLNQPIEETRCRLLERFMRILYELTNGESLTDCYARNFSYVKAWTDGLVFSNYPTKRWDQLLKYAD